MFSLFFFLIFRLFISFTHFFLIIFSSKKTIFYLLYFSNVFCSYPSLPASTLFTHLPSSLLPASPAFRSSISFSPLSRQPSSSLTFSFLTLPLSSFLPLSPFPSHFIASFLSPLSPSLLCPRHPPLSSPSSSSLPPSVLSLLSSPSHFIFTLSSPIPHP